MIEKYYESDTICSMLELDPTPKPIIDDSEIARRTMDHVQSSGMPAAQLAKFELACSYNSLDREAFEMVRLNSAIVSLEEPQAVEMHQAVKRGSMLAFMAGREAASAYHVPQRFLTQAWLETTANNWRFESADESVPPLTAKKHQLREQAMRDFAALSRPLQELVAAYYATSQDDDDFDSLVIGFGLVMPTLHEKLESLARTEQKWRAQAIESELRDILAAGL